MQTYMYIRTHMYNTCTVGCSPFYLRDVCRPMSDVATVAALSDKGWTSPMGSLGYYYGNLFFSESTQLSVLHLERSFTAFTIQLVMCDWTVMRAPLYIGLLREHYINSQKEWLHSDNVMTKQFSVWNQLQLLARLCKVNRIYCDYLDLYV